MVRSPHRVGICTITVHCQIPKRLMFSLSLNTRTHTCTLDDRHSPSHSPDFSDLHCGITTHDVIRRRMSWSTCRLFGTKSLSEPMLTCQPDHLKQTSVKFQSKYFFFKKMYLNRLSAKWGPFCPDLIVIIKTRVRNIFRAGGAGGGGGGGGKQW